VTTQALPLRQSRDTFGGKLIQLFFLIFSSLLLCFVRGFLRCINLFKFQKVYYFHVLVLSPTFTCNRPVHGLYALRSGPSSLVATERTYLFFKTVILLFPSKSTSPTWKRSCIICLTAIALGFHVQKFFQNRSRRFLGKYLVYSILDFHLFCQYLTNVLYVTISSVMPRKVLFFLLYIRSQRDVVFSFRYVRMRHGPLMGTLKT
jgi:hypothetical protein